MQGRQVDILWQEEAETEDKYDDQEWQEAAWLEEEECEILANFLEVRRKLQERKLGRGYFKSAGKEYPREKQEGDRLARLKQKTKCARCGKPGHWAKECRNPPDEKGRQRQFHGWLEMDELDPEPQNEEHYFVGWMTEMKNAAQSSEQFVGLTVQANMAIVDTGAQCCVAGLQTMQRYWEEWRRRGLMIQKEECHKKATGIGGSAKICGGIRMAAGLGGVNGILQITVVDADVPLLLPVTVLKQLGAVVDLPAGVISWTGPGTQSQFKELASGHLTVRCDEFASGGWQPPCSQDRSHHDKKRGVLGAGKRHVSPLAWKASKSDDGPEVLGPVEVDQPGMQALAGENLSPLSQNREATRQTVLIEFWNKEHRGKGEREREGSRQNMMAEGWNKDRRKLETEHDSQTTCLEGMCDRSAHKSRHCEQWKCGLKEKCARAESANLRLSKEVGEEKSHVGALAESSQRTRGSSTTLSCAGATRATGAQEEEAAGGLEEVHVESPDCTSLRKDGDPYQAGDAWSGASIGGNGSSRREAIGPVEVKESDGGRSKSVSSPHHPERTKGESVRRQWGDLLGDMPGLQKSLVKMRDESADQDRCGEEERRAKEAEAGTGATEVPRMRPIHDSKDQPCHAAAVLGMCGLPAVLGDKGRSSVAHQCQGYDGGQGNRLPEGRHCGDLRRGHGTSETREVSNAWPRSIEPSLKGALVGPDEDCMDLPHRVMLPEEKKKIDSVLWQCQGEDKMTGRGAGEKGWNLRSGAVAYIPDACQEKQRKAAIWVHWQKEPMPTQELMQSWKSCQEGINEGKVCVWVYTKHAGESRHEKVPGLSGMLAKGQAVEVCVGDQDGDPGERVAIFTNSIEVARRARNKGKIKLERALVQEMLDKGKWNMLVAPTWGMEEGSPVEDDMNVGEDEDLVLDDEEVPLQEEEKPDEKQMKMLQLAYEHMGHPTKRSFARTLHLGGARPGIVTWVRKNFRCGQCESHGRPAPIRKAATPKMYEFNVQVHLDLIEVPGPDKETAWTLLNCVCRGTRYQIVERVQRKTAMATWRCFQKAWIKHYGPPRMVVVDGGPEFGQEFVGLASEAGVQTYVVNARAPWENGVAERHGGLLKRQLLLARDSTGTLSGEDREEWYPDSSEDHGNETSSIDSPDEAGR